MSQSDYIKRFKILIKNERELERMENHIALKVDKYNTFMMDLHILLLEQSRKEKKLREEIELLERDNERMEKIIAMAEERMVTWGLHCKKQIELAAEQESKRQNILQTVNKLDALEESSKVYLKFQELPARLAGIIVCEEEQNSKWTTFDIDPIEHTQAQLQDLIWQKAEQDSRIYQEQWKMLFFPLDS